MSLEKPDYETDWQKWGELKKLYEEKKKIGGAAFSNLRESFYNIINAYSDVIEESSIQTWTSLADADSKKLKDLLHKLVKTRDRFSDDYKEKLGELNSRIQALEDKLGLEKIEEDRDMHILNVEAEFKGDDLPFRPAEEWYNPTIENIKKVLK